MTPASHAADLASVREVLGCTPDLAELKLRDLRHERDLDALYRASPGACLALGGDPADYILKVGAPAHG